MNVTWLEALSGAILSTVLDVTPIALILMVFQVAVLRRAIPHLKRVMVGFGYVIIGLALFLVGLEEALFPIGRIMAQQLTDPAFIAATGNSDGLGWRDYLWVYLFAGAIGFATTIAEPALIAVGMKAEEVSSGAVNARGLRIAVAIGVGLSIAVGAFRIVTGAPLYLFMIVGYLAVIAQTMFAPRMIIPLAYDSGGVTTSTVTVPLVTALGLGLATTVPDRSPLLDGFGLIALASLFPMMAVMAYAQIGAFLTRRRLRHRVSDGSDGDALRNGP